jgi:hypothetical protein
VKETFFEFYYKQKGQAKSKKIEPLLMSYYKLDMGDPDKEEHLCIFAFVSR